MIGLVILLIVFALLMAVILAPIAAIKAHNAGLRIHELEGRLEMMDRRLSQSLIRMEGLALEKAAQQAAADPPPQPDKEPAMSTHDAVDAHESQPEPVPEPTDEALEGPAEPAADEPAPKEQALTTLEALRAARQHMQEQVDAEAVEDSDTSSEEEQAALIDQAAIEPPAPPMPPEPPVSVSGGADDAPPPRKLTIEEVLAGKVFVWIGAIALVLTAAFLLKLGFEHNVITKQMRVIGAGVLGFALWGVGEWMRRRTPMIAQALCGASVAVLYATILAAHNLYGLLGSGGATLAFGMMATVTGGAVVLSLRHGPAVAVIGMIGGFMLPPVLNEGFAGPTAGMVLYLLAIEVGVLAITGRRGWFGINALALTFTLAWSLGYTLVGDSPAERSLVGMLVIGTAVAYLVQTARIHRDAGASASMRRGSLVLSIIAVCAAALLSAILSAQGDYKPEDQWMLALVAAGVMVLARIDRRYLFMPFVLLGLSVIVILSGSNTAVSGVATRQVFTATAVGYGLLFMLGGYVCLWRSRDRKVFAVLSAIAGPVYLTLVVLINHQEMGLREHWWPYTLALAGVYAVAALPMLRRRKAEDDWPIGAFALVSFLLVCVGALQGLDHPWAGVVLAVAAAGAALIDRGLYIRPLLIASWAVSGLVAVLLVVPGPYEVQAQGVVVFNTYLPMYAVPALCFAVIAWCSHHAGEQYGAVGMLRLSAAALAAMLVVLTRDAFQPVAFMAEQIDLYEPAAYACVLMLGAFAGLALAARFKIKTLREASVFVASSGALIGFVGALGPGNPLLRLDDTDGPPLWLGLVGLYALPAALMWLWTRRSALAEASQTSMTLRAAAIMLLAAFVGLQVRNGFQPENLHAASLGMFEAVTYGFAWMLLGLAMQWRVLASPVTAPTRGAGRVLVGIGLGSALLVGVLVYNPLWTDESVGQTVVFNGLWYLYGPTIVVLALIARSRRAGDEQGQAKLAGFTAIGLGFLLLSLLVRQGFSEDGVLVLNARPDDMEKYAYSLAWVLLGAGLLVAGVLTRLDTLRYGSLAVLLVAVGKVFLIDTSSLDDLLRVFSFFGLGVTLIGLGYLYQRLVFRRPNLLQKGAQAA